MAGCFRLIGIFYFLNTIENIYSMMIERKLKHLNLGLLYSLDERLFKKIAGCF
jgi:hypothetical protein